jgi:hypothetical protein
LCAHSPRIRLILHATQIGLSIARGSTVVETTGKVKTTVAEKEGGGGGEEGSEGGGEGGGDGGGDGGALPHPHQRRPEPSVPTGDAPFGREKGRSRWPVPTLATPPFEP